jgi:predicted RNA methylase
MWSALKDKINFNLSTMVFVDFGCGTGLAILAAMMQPFHKVIGVELDSVSTDMCRENVKTFKENKHELILSTNTEIYTENMSNFKFAKDATMVLYMYGKMIITNNQ